MLFLKKYFDLSLNQESGRWHINKQNTYLVLPSFPVVGRAFQTVTPEHLGLSVCCLTLVSEYALSDLLN